MEQNWAIIDVQTNVVLFVTYWNGDTNTWSPPEGTIYVASEDASVGYIYDPDSGTFTNPYRYAIPTVTSVSPPVGPVEGGTILTITGTGFANMTKLTIGGVPATSFTLTGSALITATTPPNTPGEAAVIVTTPAGSNESNTLFTYVIT